MRMAGICMPLRANTKDHMGHLAGIPIHMVMPAMKAEGKSKTKNGGEIIQGLRSRSKCLDFKQHFKTIEKLNEARSSRLRLRPDSTGLL
jgi:hypothetical protein